MQVNVSVILTPELMAKEFWKMTSEDQCKFFESLGLAIGDETYNSQLQWWHLERELLENDLARSTFMDMAAPMFWRTLQYMEKV